MKLLNRSTANEEEANVGDQPAGSLPPAPETTPDYGQTNRPGFSGSRLGMTGLMLGAVAAILLLLVGLFFGGRWVYQQINQSGTSPKSTVQTTPPKTSSKNNAALPAPTGISTVVPPTSSVSNGPVTTSPTQAAPNAASTAPSTLTNTGPGSTLAVFVVAVVLGTAAYQLRMRRTKTEA